MPQQELTGNASARIAPRRRPLARRWRPPIGARSILQRPIAKVLGSLIAIAILLIPTTLSTSHDPPSAAGRFSPYSGPPETPLGDAPGFLSPAQFSPPDNLTTTGEYSNVQLAAGVIGTTPTLWVLYVRTVPGGHSDLFLQTGSYDPTQAWQIASAATCVSAATSCFHHATTWGYPRILLNSSSAITGDALAASGIVVAVAYSVSGTATLELSPDGGTSWTTEGSGAGASPEVMVDGGFAVLTVIRSGAAYTFTQSLACTGTGVWTLTGIEAQNATPVQMPNGSLAIIVSNVSTHTVQDFLLNSARNGYLSGITIGAWASSSTSTILNRMGSTSLATPGGWPGQETTAVDASVTFVAYTSSLNGRVQLYVKISPNSGGRWQGPYLIAPATGAIQDPVLSVSVTGSILATWRANDNGSWEVEEALLAPDGRPLYGPVPLTASGGFPTLSASSVGAALDDFGRPYFIWLAQTPAGTQVRFDGGDLSPSALVRDFIQEVLNLRSTDFAHGKASNQSSLVGMLGQVGSDIASSSFSNAITVLETEVYPAIDSSSLVLDCDAHVPLSACSTLSPAPTMFVLAGTSGQEAPSSYLTTYLIWTLEALGVETPLPATLAAFSFDSACGGGLPAVEMSGAGSGSSGTSPPTGGGSSVSPWVNVSAYGSVGQAKSAVLNPKAANLSVAWHFDSNLSSNSPTHNLPGVDCGLQTGNCVVTFCNWTTPYSYTLEVTLSGTYEGSGTTKSFNLPGNSTTVRLTNLTYDGVTYWSVEVVGHMESRHSVVVSASGACDPTQPFSSTSYSNITEGPGWGSVWTTLNVSAPNVTALNATYVRATWTTNQLVQSWLNVTTGAHPPANQADASLLQSEAFSVGPLGGGYYNLTEASRTQAGAAPGSPPPNFYSFGNTANNGHSIGATVTKEFCGLVSNTLVIEWPSFANTTTSNTTLRFFTNYAATSSVQYVEMGPAFAQTVSGITSLSVGNGSFESLVDLHGLVGWGTYNVTISAVLSKCWINYDASLGGLQFQTTADFSTWENDNSYDSISAQGGGAFVGWEVPAAALTYYSYANGTVSYWVTNNSTTKVELPVTDPYQWGYETAAGVNLTLGAPNTNYTFAVTLNYSLNSHRQTTYSATSFPYTFVYLRDTSGDGLTDAEKTAGWAVTTSNATGVTTTNLREANPRLYATNGLVDDYVEKQFGLNPTAIDSAGSHMLDTWNLTFDMGGGSSPPACPTAFECWYTNTTNPFEQAPYPGGHGSATAARSNTSGPHTTVDDSSAYDATVLWTGSTFGYLQGLILNDSSGWMRATVGKYPANGHWTLTVWGKLSWGANPLSASTPLDGIPDGYRVNPLGATYVQVSVLNWSVPSAPGGDGVAAFIHASSPSAPYYSSAVTDYSNYTAQLEVGTQGNQYSGTFVVTFSAVPTEQYMSLNLTLDLNQGPCCTAEFQTGKMDVDLENTSIHPYWNPGTNSLGFDYQVIPVYAKATTEVLVPAGNSTISNLPLGLKRYVGEQDFVYLAINDTINGTGSMSQGTIPYAQINGTSSPSYYTVTLSGGMNNILVPRSLFIASPLGQALLNGTNKAIAYTGSNSPLQPYWNPSQWHDRVTGGTYDGTTYTPGSTGFVKVYSSTTQNCSSGPSCGGIPANSAEEAGYTALALGAVIVLNLTDLNQLDGLLAGLLLNSSGNFTAWMLGATAYVPSLGLSSEIYGALANPVEINDGGYGAPGHTQNPPKTWLSEAASAVWNSVSGPLGGLISVVWSPAVAAIAFCVDIVASVASWALGVFYQTVSALKNVSSAILSAIERLASYILGLIESGLSAAVSAFGTAFRDAMSAWAAAMNGTAGVIDQFYLATNQSLRGEDRAAGANDLLDAYWPMLAVMAVLVTALTIASYVAEPLSIGADVIVGVILSVIATAFFASGFGGRLGLPGWLFGDSAGSSFGYFSSASESVFNFTESPLNSSTATALAVPDGDPYSAYAAVFAGIGSIVAEFGGLAILSSVGKDTPLGEYAGLAAGYLGNILAFAGLGVALAGVLDFKSLPSTCSNESNLVAYQGDAGISVISLGFAAAGIIALSLSLKAAPGWLTYIGIAVTIGVYALSLASIVSDYNTCK
jgi:hypothetical protein